MKTAHFDCFSGVSGDMILGALVDAGLSLKALKSALAGLSVKAYEIKGRKVGKGHLKATKVEVTTAAPPRSLKTLADLQKTFRRSRLPEAVRRRGERVLRRLVEAEAKVHGASPARIALHGMDPVDTLVDIAGAVAGLHLLKVGHVTASPVQVGAGPSGLAPAAAELLKNVPIYSSGISSELTTPTGAAILSTLAEDFRHLPPLTLSAVGYGAGSRDLQEQPNVLRVFLGGLPEDAGPYETDRVAELETQMDDLSPQIYEHLMEALLAAGALDVCFTPLIMKKGRPGVKVGVLAPARAVPDLLRLLFAETTSLGVRVGEMLRVKLPRESGTLSTRFGRVAVKVIKRGGILETVPEYEACREIARRTGLPLRKVMAEILAGLHHARPKKAGRRRRGRIENSPAGR